MYDWEKSATRARHRKAIYAKPSLVPGNFSQAMVLISVGSSEHIAHYVKAITTLKIFVYDRYDDAVDVNKGLRQIELTDALHTLRTLDFF